MKKTLLAFYFLLCAFSLQAQQLPPLEHTRQSQVITNRAEHPLYYFLPPSASIPSFPAYTPDSLKTGALFNRTGSTSPGLYRFDGTLWQLVATSGGSKHYVDSLFALIPNYTASGGVLRSGNDFRLGGGLLSPVGIPINGQQITFGGTSNNGHNFYNFFITKFTDTTFEHNIDRTVLVGAGGYDINTHFNVTMKGITMESNAQNTSGGGVRHYGRSNFFLDTAGTAFASDKPIHITNDPDTRGNTQAGQNGQFFVYDGYLNIPSYPDSALIPKKAVNDLITSHVVTKAQVGLGNADNTSDINKPVSNAQQTALNLKANQTDLTAEVSRATGSEGTNASNLATHIANVSNPHVVTKAQVGLGNADNTSDINKPVSNAQQTVLNLKANQTDLTAEVSRATGSEGTNASNLATHIANVSNPHVVTKAQVGLGNSDNTSDVNKPVSTAQQTALNTKIEILTNLSQLQAYSGPATSIYVIDSLRGRAVFDYYPSISLAADSGTLFSATGKGTGRWARSYTISDGIAPEWFGAKGDGSTDDTNPLQYTITASPTKGPIKLRSVTYKTTGQLTVSKSIRMYGTGGNYYVGLTDSLFHKNGAIIQSNLTTSDFITVTAPNCSFEGFALENTGTPTAGFGLNFTNTGGASMNRVAIKGFYNLLHVQQGVSWAFNDMRLIYPVDQGVLVENPTTPDQGDHSFSNSSILTNNNTCRPFVFKSSGGMKVNNLKIQPLLGNLSRFPIGVTIAVPSPGTSDMQWNNISVEGFSKTGFDIQGVGGYNFGNITLSNLQIYDVNAAFPITGHAIYLKKLSGVSIGTSILSDNSATANTAIQADSVNYLRIGSDVTFIGWANKVGLFGCGSSYQDLGIASIALTTSGVLYGTPVNFTQSTSGGWTGSLILASQSASKMFGTQGSATTPSFFTPQLTAAPFGNEGTTTKVLHGNAAGLNTFSQVTLTTDVSGVLPFANGGQNTLCSANLAAQTATVTLCSATPPATGTYQANAYLNITAFTSGTITVTVTFTDIHSVVKTQTFYVNGTTTSGMTAVGTYSLIPITIRPKSALVSIVATSTGTATFEVGGGVTQITGF
jgi:hypothetical protein